MQRGTLKFRVSRRKALAPAGTLQWLTWGAKWSDAADEAAEFHVYKRQKQGERIRTEQRATDLAGGVRKALDLTQGVEFTRAAVESALVRQLWPNGRPEVTTSPEIEAQDAIMSAAWDADRSELMRGYLEMRELQARIEYLAAWPLLLVRVENGPATVAGKPAPAIPPHWADLAETEMDTAELHAIMAAHQVARAEQDAGNA